MIISIFRLTCMKTFILSSGAVPVRDTAPAMAPADSCFHHRPVVFSSSVNSSGMARLSPMSSTYTQTQSILFKSKSKRRFKYSVEGNDGFPRSIFAHKETKPNKLINGQMKPKRRFTISFKELLSSFTLNLMTYRREQTSRPHSKPYITTAPCWEINDFITWHFRKPSSFSNNSTAMHYYYS